MFWVILFHFSNAEKGGKDNKYLGKGEFSKSPTVEVLWGPKDMLQMATTSPLAPVPYSHLSPKRELCH